MSELRIPTDTWNNRLRGWAIDFAEEMPVAGDIVGGMLDAFWPQDKASIWSLVKKQTERLIDKKILEAQLEERKNELRGMQDTLAQYFCAKDSERSGFLTSLLTTSNTLGEKLTGSKNSKHLIPLTVTHAQTHLALLRERVNHGKKLYGEYNDSWLHQLEVAYAGYLSGLEEAFKEWKKWRFRQITSRTYLTEHPSGVPPFFTWHSHGEAHDTLTHRRIHYEKSLSSVKSYFSDAVLAAKKMYQAEAIARMADALGPVHDLPLLLPKERRAKAAETMKKEAPSIAKLATLWQGPYGPASLGVYGEGRSTTDVEDKPGHVTEVYVREWNSIDGLQLIYTDHKGHFIGNPKGGKAHRVHPEKGEHVCGLAFRFSEGSEGIMCRVQVLFSGFTAKDVQKASDPLGNRMGWPGADASAYMGPSYALTGGKFREGDGPSGTRGTKVIFLRFSHVPASEEPGGKKISKADRDKVKRRFCSGDLPPVIDKPNKK